MRVWLEDWEWQCCGEPFAVGAEVEWGVVPLSDDVRTFLAEPLGDQIVASITHFETHHADAGDEAQPVMTRGRVESIAAVYWQIAPRAGEDPRVYYPVAGTALLKQRDAADGWEPEVEDAEFEGYIVDLMPLD